MREPSASLPSPLEDRFTYYGADERPRAADYQVHRRASTHYDRESSWRSR